MSHLLIIELPGGNDTDILEAALRRGHTFSFLTQDLSVYQKYPKVKKWVDHAVEIIESASFSYEDIEALVLNTNQRNKIDGLLCLLDIRLIEASKLAKRLHVRYLNVESAVLLRDKFSVRERLRRSGIEQPDFALATTNQEVIEQIETLGLPLLIKPSDGYGSQNILTLETQEDLVLAKEVLGSLLPISADYGLGVRSNDRLLLERYMRGTLIGCDVLTLDGKHKLLGINEKLMFSPPSFAIRGGCFVPNRGEWAEFESYLFSILDAVGFDCGATHIELIVTALGPRLVEINPRLVGAKIPRLISYALNRSIHEALIDLHLGVWPLDDLNLQEMRPSATRWLISPTNGVLQQVELPNWEHAGIKCVEMLKNTGDQVAYPYENAQRLGYVMTSAESRVDAEELAERFITDSRVVVT